MYWIFTSCISVLYIYYIINSLFAWTWFPLLFLSSGLIILLSKCGPDGSAIHAPEIVREVICNERIIKVGVGIDDDALELFRWSKRGYEKDMAVRRNKNIPKGIIAQQQQQQNNQQYYRQSSSSSSSSTPQQSESQPKLWEMKSRFDIGSIIPKTNSSRRLGIQELGYTILGVNILKSKKLAMSNWCNKHLTMEQISYAARDAWTAAAVMERLQLMNNEVFGADSLSEMDFMKSQRSVDVMDERARLRKEAKMEMKEFQEKEKMRRELIATAALNGKVGDDDSDNKEEEEARKKELFVLLDLYRPDAPPTFDEDAFTLPFY